MKRNATISLAVISDTHISAAAALADRSLWVNWMMIGRAEKIARRLVKEINRRQPDLVLHAGDITNRGDVPSIRLAAAIFKGFSAPFHFTVGAHDTYLRGARHWWARAFGCRNFDLVSESVDLGRWCVIFLDSSWWLKKDGSEHAGFAWKAYRAGCYSGVAAPKAGIVCLARQLHACRHQFVVLVTHHPMARKPMRHYRRMLLPDGPGARRHPPTIYDACFENSPEIRKLIRRFPNVKLVINGHDHMNEIVVQDGMVFCTVAATCVYPMEYRWIELADDRISVSTLAYPNQRLVRQSFAGKHWPRGQAGDRQGVFRIDNSIGTH